MTETYAYIYLFENNAETTLASDYTAGQTQMTVADDSDFPGIVNSYDAFRCVIYDDQNAEYFTVTAAAAGIFRHAALSNSYAAGAKIEAQLDEEILKSFVQKGNIRTVTSDPESPGLAAIYFGEEVMYNDGLTDIWYKNTAAEIWERVTGAS